MPRKRKMCKYLPLHPAFYQFIWKKCLFASSMSSSGCSHLVCTLAMKSSNRLAHKVLDTFATHVGLVQDNTGTHCRGHKNSSAHRNVFLTFRCRLLAHMMINLVKNCSALYFLISFLSIVPLTSWELFASSDALTQHMVASGQHQLKQC